MHTERLTWLVAVAALAMSGAAAGQGAPPAGSSEDPGPAPEAVPSEADQERQQVAEAGAAAGAEDDKPYTVECGPDPEQAGANVCRTDRDTYVGWRTFHSVCHTCHAQDAVGSSFAPALLPRIRQMDKARFVEVVDKGFTGQVGVMPGWGMNPNVNRFYDELWSYLRARADGALPPGRPKRLESEN